MSGTPAQTAKPYGEISVIGAGAWGTALAAVAAAATGKALIWAREPEAVAAINERHENTIFLPGIALPAGVEATGDLARAAHAEALLVAAPAQHLRSTLRALRPLAGKAVPLVLCAKGIETATGKLVSEILAEEVPGAEPAILSGPSFARDAARGMPTLVTVAAKREIAERLQATLRAARGFRPYVSEDITGVALGGAAKNVYAIACGVVEGGGYGESARAGLLARGFAELLRLGAALGARPETLMGLSGLGDLVLTATSVSSRNFAFGAAIGSGKKPAELLAPGKPLAEGAATAPALVARGLRHNVELPIAEAVAGLLSGKFDVAGAAEWLLSRPLGME